MRIAIFSILFFNSIQCFDCTISPVHENDNLAEIIALVHQAYKRVLFFKENSRITEQELVGMINNKTKRLYLGRDGNKICGTIVLDLSVDKPEIGMFAVHPDYQGKGLGKKLIDHVEKEAALLQVNRLYLRVIPFCQEDLVLYYIKQGYKFSGAIKSFNESHAERYVKKEYWNKTSSHVMYKDINTP